MLRLGRKEWGRGSFIEIYKFLLLSKSAVKYLLQCPSCLFISIISSVTSFCPSVGWLFRRRVGLSRFPKRAGSYTWFTSLLGQDLISLLENSSSAREGNWHILWNTMLHFYSRPIPFLSPFLHPIFIHILDPPRYLYVRCGSWLA